MRLDPMRILVGLAGLGFGIALAAGHASADPLGFSANQDSSDVSVVDLTTLTTRAPSDPEPTGLRADGRGGRSAERSGLRVEQVPPAQLRRASERRHDAPAVFSGNTLDKGSALALDAGRRRVLMDHGDMPGFGSGIVGQYSITNPVQPVFVAEHLVPVVAGASTNLRFIAYNWFQRCMPSRTTAGSTDRRATAWRRSRRWRRASCG